MRESNSPKFLAIRRRDSVMIAGENQGKNHQKHAWQAAEEIFSRRFIWFLAAIRRSFERIGGRVEYWAFFL
jgi:hypothetical protein